MVHGWQLEQKALELFKDATRSNTCDILAFIDSVPTMIAVCKSSDASLSVRVYPSDWAKMKQWCVAHYWNRLVLVYFRQQWYKITDLDWLDQKVCDSQTKSQVAIGVTDKAVGVS